MEPAKEYAQFASIHIVMFDFFSGLLHDGLLPVFTTLLSFLPQVVILLTIVALFENSGFILGFGCTTLAVSAIDSQMSQRDKSRLVRFLSFIPCSAKLPVLVFLVSVILGWTVFGVVFLYLVSILIGLVFGGFYVVRCPRLKKITIAELVVIILKKTLEFLKRISFGVLIAATSLYTLQYFSLLLYITGVLEPLFIPIGLGSAAVIACLAFGLVAKEMIVGAVLALGVVNLGLTMASALSFIVFVLLYTPCISALVAIKAKLGIGAALKTAFFNLIIAYGAAFIVYTIAVLV